MVDNTAVLVTVPTLSTITLVCDCNAGGKGPMLFARAEKLALYSAILSVVVIIGQFVTSVPLPIDKALELNPSTM